MNDKLKIGPLVLGYFSLTIAESFLVLGLQSFVRDFSASPIHLVAQFQTIMLLYGRWISLAAIIYFARLGKLTATRASTASFAGCLACLAIGRIAEGDKADWMFTADRVWHTFALHWIFVSVVLSVLLGIAIHTAKPKDERTS